MFPEPLKRHSKREIKSPSKMAELQSSIKNQCNSHTLLSLSVRSEGTNGSTQGRSTSAWKGNVNTSRRGSIVCMIWLFLERSLRSTVPNQQVPIMLTGGIEAEWRCEL